MKISEHWLREWVNPALNRADLCERLTMSGLEVEAVTPVAEQFSGVVIGKVLRVEKHPEADRLHVCEVDTGGPEPLTIVCGAKNVVAGMKTAAALDGAVLSKKIKIKTSKLRGVMSHGMLCSPVELGLAETSDGLIVLPDDAPIGTAVWDYFQLSDFVIEISITPNRGDCLSVLGLAHEISALTETKSIIPIVEKIHPENTDQLSVTIAEKKECPRYVGRVIRNVTADATTPMWLQERLRRGGIRCISPVVDVMNYVMLEFGQPMHAFDLAKINGGIQVRMANASEQLELLDGQTVQLTPQTLVIADQQKPLAIAGVMGGMESAVTLLTKDIFLESAFFQPTAIARMGRHYNIGSESSYRFERGIDPTLQAEAIERATKLILAIAGGTPGPLVDVAYAEHLPQPKQIEVRKARVATLLGIQLTDSDIEKIIQRLGFPCEKTSSGWRVTTPPRRSDLTTEVDVIEEIIRLHGYEKIPVHFPRATMQITPRSEKKLYLPTIRKTLTDLGYREVITYSFIDKKNQQLFDPERRYKELLNPLTAEMSVMRTSLWPGLVTTLLYNLNRQQSRIRIFESGLRFIFAGDEFQQQPVLSGLITGQVMPEQWGEKSRAVDFFDLKGDIQNLIRKTKSAQEFDFQVGSHPALHPGQTADIYRLGEKVGVIGALHPAVLKAFDLTYPVFVFEILLDSLEIAQLPRYQEVSKFPEIRRDIAILVDRAVPAKAISDTITEVAGDLLQNVNIFDVYQGKGVAPDRKSVALALTLQHVSRTLIEEEVANLMDRVCVALKERFAAELRG